MTGDDIIRDWGAVLLLATGLLAGIVLLTLVAWQGFKTLQAWLVSRSASSREEQYKSIAERSIAVEGDLLDRHQRLEREIAQLHASVSRIERLLKEVS